VTPRTRTILLTAASFTLVAAVLASPAWLPALAATSEPVSTLAAQAIDIFTPPPPDYSRLIRRSYQVAPSVSTEPIRQSVVRKIEAGRITDVVVTETATGVYSSDGLANAHVNYPGIRVTDELIAPIEIALMINGEWITRPALTAGSIVSWPAKN
jgi:hypothetical protein